MVSGRVTFTELKYSKRRQKYIVEPPPHITMHGPMNA